ncbi:protein of unknown function [Brevefilum fermentans]|uniref:Uncharacterized protein n=1 Tax=Candidatus Brevifilum fermentans TaxID=1986204 RepID=A0A1Y6K5Z1_9CHLR|nr:protein of unknown function [Brevefilum fermentans]
MLIGSRLSQSWGFIPVNGCQDKLWQTNASFYDQLEKELTALPHTLYSKGPDFIYHCQQTVGALGRKVLIESDRLKEMQISLAHIFCRLTGKNLQQ